MLHGVRHLIEVEATFGDAKPLAPQLESVRGAQGVREPYELPGVEFAELRTTNASKAFRVELRSDGILFGWEPLVSRSKLARAVHSASLDGQAFYAIKNGQIREQIPWRPALPAFIVESPHKLEAVRLDTNSETIAWERVPLADGPGEMQALVPTGQVWAGLFDLVVQTASKDMAQSIVGSAREFVSGSK
jgi:hypothetical protein